MNGINRTAFEVAPESGALELDQFEFEFSEEADLDSPFTEAEEMELATELLNISSEAELDQFLGKLFKGAWKGIKKVGKFVGKVARPLGGVLKGIAKQALPFVGGALGSFIPIPGVGTALGSALGSAVSSALETELEGLTPEDRELEMARRFVRLAGTSARRAALSPPTMNPRAAATRATFAAARRHIPGLFRPGPRRPFPPRTVRPGLRPGIIGPVGPPVFAPPETVLSTHTGRWIRRGPSIVILNCYGGVPSTGALPGEPAPPPEAPLEPEPAGDEGGEEFGGF
jgi:hypothetical protein